MARAILEELRCKIEEALRNGTGELPPDFAARQLRYEVLVFPEEGSAVGIAWVDGAPEVGLILITSTVEEYLRARRDCANLVIEDYAGFVQLSRAQLKVIWPFILGRFTPLQALAAADLAPE